MRHCFLIMAHNNWNQLKVLLRLLDDSRNTIYLHVDAAAKDFKPSELDGLLQNALLQLIPRMKITWGGYSQVRCEVELLKRALKSNSDYYHLISGMDLPLHGMDYIDNFFEKNKGKEFIHFTEYGDTLETNTRERIAFYHPFQEKLGRNFKISEYISNSVQRIMHIDRLQKQNLILGKGANWFSISKDFSLYFMNSWNVYKCIFMHSLCADEMLMQTVILNSPYKNRLYRFKSDDSYKAIMRLIDWKRGNPYVFTVDDYTELIQSPMLFARKFDEKKDWRIIQMIADYIQHTIN